MEPRAGPATEPRKGLTELEESLVLRTSIIILNINMSRLYDLIKIYIDKKKQTIKVNYHKKHSLENLLSTNQAETSTTMYCSISFRNRSISIDANHRVL